MQETKVKKPWYKRKLFYSLVIIILIVGVFRSVTGYDKPILELRPIKAEVEEITEESSDVAMVQSDKKEAKDLTVEDIRTIVREAVSLAGGLETIVADGDVVVLKPNLMAITDSSGNFFAAMSRMSGDTHAAENLLPKEVNGVTTDWRVIKAVAEMVRELNPSGKIYVMEGSGSGLTAEKYELMGYTQENIPQVDEFISMDDSGKSYETTGGEDLLAVDIGEYGLYDFSESLSYAKDYYYFDKLVYEADVLISIPVLKNHQMASITGSIKNVSVGATPPCVYGASPFGGPNEEGPGRGAIDHSWEPLNNWIHDYYIARPIDFTVTDGLQSMEMGPMAMSAPSTEAMWKNKRLILAGRDALAVDTVHGLITGVDTWKVKYIQDLGKAKVGYSDVSRINIVGNVEIDDVRESYKYPGAPYSWMNPVPRTLTYSDFEEPEMSLDLKNFEDGVLVAVLEADENLVKVDVLVDGELLETVREDSTTVNVNIINEKLSTATTVELVGFDKYLNSASISVK